MPSAAPWRSRAAKSIGSDCAYANASVAAARSARPTIIGPLRPTRSEMRAHRNREHEQRDAERGEQQPDHRRAGVEPRRVVRQHGNGDGVRDEIGERRGGNAGKNDGPIHASGSGTPAAEARATADAAGRERGRAPTEWRRCCRDCCRRKCHRRCSATRRSGRLRARQ